MSNLLKALEIDMSEVRCCPECGAKEVRVEVKSWHFTPAHDSAVELSVIIPIWTCGACSFEYTDGRGEAIEEKAIRCFLQRRLSPQEIRCIRKRRGWSRAEFARHTGYAEKSVKRWETGALMQSASADRFLRLLDSDEVARQVILLSEKIAAAK